MNYDTSRQKACKAASLVQPLLKKDLRTHLPSPFELLFGSTFRSIERSAVFRLKDAAGSTQKSSRGCLRPGNLANPAHPDCCLIQPYITYGSIKEIPVLQNTASRYPITCSL